MTTTAPPRVDAKTLAGLQARAAMAGIRVDPIEGDDGRTVWVVTRWALTRQCASIDEVRELLQKMGVVL